MNYLDGISVNCYPEKNENKEKVVGNGPIKTNKKTESYEMVWRTHE